MMMGEKYNNSVVIGCSTTCLKSIMTHLVDFSPFPYIFFSNQIILAIVWRMCCLNPDHTKDVMACRLLVLLDNINSLARGDAVLRLPSNFSHTFAAS